MLTIKIIQSLEKYWLIANSYLLIIMKTKKKKTKKNCYFTNKTHLLITEARRKVPAE